MASFRSRRRSLHGDWVRWESDGDLRWLYSDRPAAAEALRSRTRRRFGWRRCYGGSIPTSRRGETMGGGVTAAMVSVASPLWWFLFGGVAAALLELRGGCNGAPSDLQSSFGGAVDIASKLHQDCNGVPPELQWSLAGAVDAALELHRGCNGAWPELQWSFTGAVGAALELHRGCNEAWSDAIDAALELCLGCNGTGLTRCCHGFVVIQWPQVC